MPNRILKESICSSDSISQLSWFEEVFFLHLIVNCDDYGRMDARPAILKAKLFPLKDRITNRDIESALEKLADVGCVMRYSCDGKPYLRLPAWEVHQSVRAKRSKYPSHLQADECTCKQMQADASRCSRNPIQSESQSLSESNPNPVEGGRRSTFEGGDPVEGKRECGVEDAECRHDPVERESGRRSVGEASRCLDTESGERDPVEGERGRRSVGEASRYVNRERARENPVRGEKDCGVGGAACRRDLGEGESDRALEDGECRRDPVEGKSGSRFGDAGAYERGRSRCVDTESEERDPVERESGRRSEREASRCVEGGRTGSVEEEKDCGSMDTACRRDPGGEKQERGLETGEYKQNEKEHQKDAKKSDPFLEYAGEDGKLRKALKDFEIMRGTIKKPLTRRAKQLIVTELMKITEDRDEKIAVLEQSIMHNWQDVYALKGMRMDGKSRGSNGGNAGSDPDEFSRFNLDHVV